jgi:hypothetical protein
MPGPDFYRHAICLLCWDERVETRPPIPVSPPLDVEQCCYCGRDTTEGVYKRGPLRDAPCCSCKVHR